MLNQTVLVGRIANKPTIKKLEDGKKVSYITLAVPRSFKNADGIYDTDFIDCVLWKSVAESTCEYCKQGDLVGIKGRLQIRHIELEDGSTKKYIEVIAEKVTFLSTKKEEE